MAILDKRKGSNNAASDFSTKIFLPSKTKDVNVKAFSLMTKANEANDKHRSCGCKYKFINVIQIKNRTIKHGNVNVKTILCAKRIIVVILPHVFVRTAS